MDFNSITLEEKAQYTELLFTKLNSLEDTKNWVYSFLGLDMPMTWVDPDSNSSPIGAIWTIYEMIKNNDPDHPTSVIMLSARAGYKTLSAAIVELLLMLHFELTITHLAAIREQSSKAVEYVNLFFSKVQPLLDSAGWTSTSKNKTRVEYMTAKQNRVYIQVIVATLQSTNGQHSNLTFIDEIDIVKDPKAYDEAKLVPEYEKGIYPLTVKLSTRKFAFGLMQKEITSAPITGDQIIRWNIIDVTERCPTSRHKPNLPKIDRYVNKNLPLRQLSVEEYETLSIAEQSKWELLSAVHGGCVDCPLLPVCKTRLASRSSKDKGGLFKPISLTISNIKKLPPDMAEAQMLCWRPSSQGLVYPRFSNELNTGNVISLHHAWETLMGEPSLKKHIPEIDLIQKMKQVGIRFYAGVDWGFSHDFVIVIFALIPNGEIWIVDCFGAPGLEFAECLEIAKSYRDKYGCEKWYCDQAMPANIKSFTRNGMKCPTFTKDVAGGINALRSKITDGYGRRLLKVLDNDANKGIIEAFLNHHFKLGSDGNPTQEPDDDPGVSDRADAMRYVAQCLFPIKGTQQLHFLKPEGVDHLTNPDNSLHTNQMMEEIAKRTGGAPFVSKSGRKGGFHFDF